MIFQNPGQFVSLAVLKDSIKNFSLVILALQNNYLTFKRFENREQLVFGYFSFFVVPTIENGEDFVFWLVVLFFFCFHAKSDAKINHRFGLSGLNY